MDGLSNDICESLLMGPSRLRCCFKVEMKINLKLNENSMEMKTIWKSNIYQTKPITALLPALSVI